MVAAAYDPIARTARAAAPAKVRPQSPPDEDPPIAGTLIPAPKPPPKGSPSAENCCATLPKSPELQGFGSRVTDYSYRYYHPNLGRWISRDPIGERGGLNLYAFSRNNGVQHLDRFGLVPFNLNGYPFTIHEGATQGGTDSCVSAGGEWTDFIEPERVENYTLIGVIGHKFDKIDRWLAGGDELDAIDSAISAVWDKNPCKDPKTVISYDISQVPEKLKGYIGFNGESIRLAIQSRVLAEDYLNMIKAGNLENNNNPYSLKKAIKVRFCCACITPKGWKP